MPPVFSKITAKHYHYDTSASPLFQSRIEDAKFSGIPYTNDFMFYRPNHLDWNYQEVYGQILTSLNPSIAHAIYATVFVQLNEIFTAAYGKNYLSTLSVPKRIDQEKLNEIGMPYPPIPSWSLHSNNFLATQQSSKDFLRLCISNWQQSARQLAAWIERSKEICKKKGITSWQWSYEVQEPVMEKEMFKYDSTEDLLSESPEYCE